MYEEIDLDAIESNKDEAPDYRPMLKESGGLGAPASVDDSRYRVKVLSTLESEERSSYSEFARVAEREGLSGIAKVFKEILKEEHGHSQELPRSETLTNLKTSIMREKQKIQIMQSMMDESRKDGDFVMVDKLKGMIADEQGHVDMLSKAAAELEDRMDREAPKKDSRAEKEMVCSFGRCTEKTKFEEGFDSRLNDGD